MTTDAAIADAGAEAERRVVYLGPEGTFTHIAVRHLFPAGSGLELQPGASVAACFDALAHGRCGRIVVPVENGAKGYVGDTVEQMTARGAELAVLASAEVPVTFSLYRLPGDRGTLHTIASHPFGLAQVKGWSSARPLKELETPSTSAALELLARERTAGMGAVAAPGIGDLYGLEELETDLQGPSVNATRFLCIGRGPAGRAEETAQGYVAFLAKDPAALAPALARAAQDGLIPAVAPAKQGPAFGGYRYVLELHGPGASRAAAPLAGVPGLIFLGAYAHSAVRLPPKG